MNKIAEKCLKVVIIIFLFHIVIALVMAPFMNRDELFQRSNRVKTELIKDLESSGTNKTFNDLVLQFKGNSEKIYSNKDDGNNIARSGVYNYLSNNNEMYKVKWNESRAGVIEITDIALVL